MAIISLEKRPVSLSIVTQDIVLVGEKAGFISKIEFNSKLEEVKKIAGFSLPFLLMRNASEEKCDNKSVRRNIIVGGVHVSHTICAGCVTSLLVQIKMQPNQKKLVALCDRDMKIKIYNYPDLFLVERILMGHRDYVTSCCFLGSEDNRLLSGSYDGSLKLWDVHRGTCVASLNLKSSHFFEDRATNGFSHLTGAYPILIDSITESMAVVATRNPSLLLLIDCELGSACGRQIKLKYSSKVDFNQVEITCVSVMHKFNLVAVGLRHPQSKDLKPNEECIGLFSIQSQPVWALNRNTQLDSVSSLLGMKNFSTEFFSCNLTFMLDFETVSSNPFDNQLSKDKSGQEDSDDVAYFGLSLARKMSPGTKVDDLCSYKSIGEEMCPIIKKPKLDELNSHEESKLADG